jgi:biotin carboxyl carrier protein
MGYHPFKPILMEIDTRTLEKPSNGHPVREEIADDCGNPKVRCKTLIIHGVKYRTTYTQKFENRKKWEKPNPKQLVSFIPGTIDEIYIKEGDRVNKGDKLLVLEAMKMLNTIEVPVDGKIRKINIKKGDKIPKGFVMIEFE